MVNHRPSGCVRGSGLTPGFPTRDPSTPFEHGRFQRRDQFESEPIRKCFHQHASCQEWPPDDHVVSIANIRRGVRPHRPKGQLAPTLVTTSGPDLVFLRPRSSSAPVATVVVTDGHSSSRTPRHRSTKRLDSNALHFCLDGGVHSLAAIRPRLACVTRSTGSTRVDEDCARILLNLSRRTPLDAIEKPRQHVPIEFGGLRFTSQ